MSEAVLYGAEYSVYVRAARLTVAEKGVACRLVPVDVFAPGGPPAEHLARQPFGRIPAFEHDGFSLYETGAITRYLDDAFPGPALQPSDPRARARMNQAIGVIDSYVYPTLVWDIYVERVSLPKQGRSPDEAKIAEAVTKARTCLEALCEIMGDGPWLAGPEISLADFHAAPMIAYFVMAPEGAALLDQYPRMSRWWSAMRARPSMAATRPAGVPD
ncbi:glutathione S-transferase family protein [Phenylobacterium sp.]|uniref:glutathione S-transferase family protein n=1 Tax=Phenylobacterium sp. TaxID=1871053 RepID=UPI00286D40D1|nr:glutathione S-transferase family protein [Phenylobacterium sp.]